MRSFLLAVVLIAAAAPARAQLDGGADWAKKLAETAKELMEMAPVQVDPAPIDKLFDKVVREGDDVATADGWAVAVQGPAFPAIAGEELTVGAVLATRVLHRDPDVRDLVFRRAFTRLYAVRRVTTDAGQGYKRTEVWRYRLGFEGSLFPVEHSVLVYKPMGGAKVRVDVSRSSSEDLKPKDPAVQQGWKDLAPRLLTVSRVIEA